MQGHIILMSHDLPVSPALRNLSLFLRIVVSIPQWPMSAVRDITRDGRWSTYDVRVLKLANVPFRGKCAHMGNTLKLPSPTKLVRLGHFPPASQAGRLACLVFYVYVLSLVVSLYEYVETL